MRFLVVLFALVAVGMAAPAENKEKRSLGQYTVAYGVPTAVSHQSRVDVHSAPLEVAVVPEPVYAARTVAYAPAVHQSPVVTSYATPAVVEARNVYSPVHTVYSTPTVAHQSRVVSQQVVSPAVYEARSVYSPSVYSPSVYSPSVYSPSVYSPSVYGSYW